ncbi:MAG: oligosaccharide flippase family protein [Clostridia bacterium]|nr:oligosaccharide flippase family protein [Clostridia bacterium]
MAKSSKWQMSTNLIANIVSFVSALFISFYTTPYITKHVGMEAYGLIGLAQNFTNYVTIITASLNSMASRFIVIQLHKNNDDEANKFFNSALIANTLCALIVILLSVIMIPNLNHFINVSEHLLPDAKATFALTFFSFALSLATSVFGVVYFAKNRIDLGAWRTVESNIIRSVLLVITFVFIGVKIQYTVAVTLISTVYTILFSVYYTYKLLPQINVSVSNFHWNKVWTMVKAGIWNSIGKLSHILLNGLDLLITNLFIGGAVLGCVSVTKTFVNLIISLISTISDVYVPKFLKAYAKDKESLNTEFLASTKLLGFCSCVIISVFLVYCQTFYELWLPGEDAVLMRNLTYISLASIFVSGPVYAMFSIYTVINRVRPQAVATLITSVISTGTVFLLLKFTDLGVYAIVGVSAILGAVKNLTYNMFYLRKYAGINLKRSYVIILKNIMIALICTVINMCIKSFISITSLVELAACIMVAVLVSAIVFFVLGIGYDEKKAMLKFAATKLKLR